MGGEGDRNEKNPRMSKVIKDIFTTGPVPPAQGILPHERFRGIACSPATAIIPHSTRPLGAKALGHPSHSTE